MAPPRSRNLPSDDMQRGGIGGGRGAYL
jgi:hypothetical protein